MRKPGGYEDVCGRTSEERRIRSRTHVRNEAWNGDALTTPDLS